MIEIDFCETRNQRRPDPWAVMSHDEGGRHAADASTLAVV
jgi:hypothetical protein